MGKIGSIVLTIILVFIFIGVALYTFFGNPLSIMHAHMISGGNPGRYHDGENVLVMKRALLSRSLKVGDVVVYPFYNNPNQTMIGEIVVLPGGDIPNPTHKGTEILTEGKLPENTYVVQRNHISNDIVQLDAIDGVVIYP